MAAKTMNRSNYDVRLALRHDHGGWHTWNSDSAEHHAGGDGTRDGNTRYPTCLPAAVIPRNNAGVNLHCVLSDSLLAESRIWVLCCRESERPKSMKEVWREFLLGLIPPSALVFSALGKHHVRAGNTDRRCGLREPAAHCCCPLAYRKLTWKKLFTALIKTLEITALIMLLVAASNFFGAVFSRLGTPMMLTDFLLDLEVNRYVVLMIVMALIFLLGWPLEWVPIVLIIVPILIPLIDQLQFNLTWFAILVAVNLQTAWLSPPVALSAYFLKGVVPEWDLKDIYYGMMQFMLLQLVGLALIISFPQLVLWLPGVIYGGN